MASTTVTVDLTPPTPVLKRPLSGVSWPVEEPYYTNRTQLALHGATESSTDQVSVNGTPVDVTASSNEFALFLRRGDGRQSFTVVSEDSLAISACQTLDRDLRRDGAHGTHLGAGGGDHPDASAGERRLDARGGSPLDLSRVKLMREGAEVTAQAVITPGGFRYLPDPPLREGENPFQVTLFNTAGNEGVGTWTVTVDDQSEVALHWPLDGALLNVLTQTVSGQSEPGAVVSLALNGQGVGQTTVDASGHFTFTQLLFPAAGPVTLTATATDALGNQATTSLAVTMALGQPAAGVGVAPNPYAQRTSFTLYAAGLPADPLASWQLLVNGVPITSGLVCPLPSGAGMAADWRMAATRCSWRLPPARGSTSKSAAHRWCATVRRPLPR